MAQPPKKKCAKEGTWFRQSLKPRGSRQKNNLELGFWVIGIIVQVVGEYVTIRYLDPEGNLTPQTPTPLNGQSALGQPVS